MILPPPVVREKRTVEVEPIRLSPRLRVVFVANAMSAPCVAAIIDTAIEARVAQGKGVDAQAALDDALSSLRSLHAAIGSALALAPISGEYMHAFDDVTAALGIEGGELTIENEAAEAVARIKRLQATHATACSLLTEAQRDGRACLRCGGEGGAMFIAGWIDGVQVFAHEACSSDEIDHERRRRLDDDLADMGADGRATCPAGPMYVHRAGVPCPACGGTP